MPHLRKRATLSILGFVTIGLLVFLARQPDASTESGAAPVVASIPLPTDSLHISEALLLGVVEGATEYLPVSSTGHLLVAQRVLGIGDHAGERRAADAYAIVIQAGAILAVLSVYRRRVAQMFVGLTGDEPAGLRLFVNLILAFLPAGILGVLFGRDIKTHLFDPFPIAIAWLLGGIAILLLTRWRTRAGSTEERGLTDLRWTQALWIGLAQAVALWPGISRSLVTIAGGLLLGLGLPAAVEFSFLLGFVTLTAATAWELYQEGETLFAHYGSVEIAAGFAAAFFSAMFAVRWMKTFLDWRELDKFGYYRIALAGVAGVWIALGVL
ncbi:MAG: undecaprenyl-diphosphate phosphatase [Pirellulales bacterium]|nr:undecaprenyl-diphosphate phosphatase [Pirellulales bacterium]